MKYLATLLFVLLAAPAFAQEQGQSTTGTPAFTNAPAVAPTSGVPTPDELHNAFGICLANQTKGGWRPGYESCDAVRDAINSQIEASHNQTVKDVAKRLKSPN